MDKFKEALNRLDVKTDKKFEAMVKSLDEDKLRFTMSKDEILDRILKNKKVEEIISIKPSINKRGEFEDTLDITLKVGDFIGQFLSIELTLTHTGAEEESDVYNIFGSIRFDSDDWSVGEAKEIRRLSDYHTSSGRPEGVLGWLESEIDHMTSDEVDGEGKYLRYLYN